MDFQNKYFEKILEFPILTPDEQLELVKLAQEGNKNAEEKLITSNLRFVLSISRKYSYRFLRPEDLFNIGVTGLIRAIKSFDEKKKNPFITYARWWIRSYINKEIYENENTIRIPTGAGCTADQERRKNKTNDELSFDTHNIMTLREISSFDGRIGLEDELSYSEILPDKNAQSPEHMAKDFKNQTEIIENILEQMTELEKMVIQHTFGIHRVKLTQAEIADKLEVNVALVKNLREQAIQKFQEDKKFTEYKNMFDDFKETYIH